MKNIKILLLVLFSNFLLINPIFSQDPCSEALQFNFSQNGDDVEVELLNLSSSCSVALFSIERTSYLDSDPDIPVITRILTQATGDNDGAILYAFDDNDLSPGTHRYEVILVSDCTLHILDSGEFTVGAACYDIVWTDKIGVSQNGTQLTRNVHSGWDCHSGAASLNTIPSGEDGWVEMTVTENWSTRFFGLSNSSHPNDACRYTISHSIFLHNRVLKIYEGGYIDDFMSFTVGDVIRVERIGAAIHYKKNGVTFYISQKPSYDSLMADVSIKDRYGVIGNSRCSHPAYGGLKVNTDLKNFKVYPNPTTSEGNLNIEFDFNSDETEAELHIYNINGQLMHKEAVNVQKGANTMNVFLNDYASGMYSMQLQAGEYTLSTKLVIK